MRDFSYTVRLPDETTSVFVGPLAEVRVAEPADSGCLVVDERVPAAFAPILEAFMARLVRQPGPPIVLKGGEGLKDLSAAGKIWAALSERGLDRSSLLVAAGGGATLDACGFVAATFLRGVAFAAVPTTLLAQVDAGLGGKTALNLDHVKNQIGVVRQPRLVAADPAFLADLPDRLFRSGLGELAKCALLAGGELHALMTSGAREVLRRDLAALEQAIVLALRYKADVVARDPLDRGERAVLNAGHTIGHVLEAEALRRGIDLPHGEAVAAGLSIEARADDRADPACVRAVLEGLRLTGESPFPVDAEAARSLLQRDKKQRRGAVRLPVIARPGTVVIHDVAIDRLVGALSG